VPVVIHPAGPEHPMRTTHVTAAVRMKHGAYTVHATHRGSSQWQGEPAETEITAVRDAAGVDCSDDEIAARESAHTGDSVTAGDVMRLTLEALDGADAGEVAA
jgi:hypothetical protein